MTKGIIFSDIDGTLIHKERNLENLIQIRDENVFIAESTIEKIEELRTVGYKFALITGMRKSGYERLSEVIPHDYAILKHGCLIFKGNCIDDRWISRMKAVTDGTIWEYEKQLNTGGYKTDSEGRLATVRVYIDKPRNLTEEQKQEIEKRKHPKGITTTRNQEMIDLLPVQGGKAKAIAYILEKTEALRVFCMGDDINDRDMLSMGYNTLTLVSAKKEIIELVKSQKGYVSQYKYHAGTIDMLQHIMQN